MKYLLVQASLHFNRGPNVDATEFHTNLVFYPCIHFMLCNLVLWVSECLANRTGQRGFPEHQRGHRNRKSCGAPVVIGNPDHVVQARVRVPLIIGKQITSSFA